MNVTNVKLINKDGNNENGIQQENIKQDLIDKIFELKFKDTNTINLLEYENKYALLIIDKIKKSIPNITSKKFKDKIIRSLVNGDIFQYNMKLMSKIKTNAFSELNFNQLAKKNKLEIKDILIKGMGDNNFFSIESNKQIFKLPKKGFTIVSETEKNKTFLVWLKETQIPNLDKTSEEYDKYYYKTVISLKK